MIETRIGVEEDVGKLACLGAAVVVAWQSYKPFLHAHCDHAEDNVGKTAAVKEGLEGPLAGILIVRHGRTAIIKGHAREAPRDERCGVVDRDVAIPLYRIEETLLKSLR